ncbi:chemotaxis protein CheW [Luteimonas sp. SDU82]|uniref:chemotaxis protein CheW n=2 Tax=unclassified Luteimonas TaxID=2629088 RepID=UPI003EBB69BA
MNPEGASDVIDYVDALLDDSAPAAAAAATDDGARLQLADAALAATGETTATPPAAPGLAATAAAAAAGAEPTRAPVPPHMETAAAAPAAMPMAPPLAAVPPPASLIAQSSRWLRVVVGRDSYALELLRVQEVVRVVPIVPMRGARAAVLGVMNLRGRIVPVFDLGLWLETGQVDADEHSRIVVIERDDELIGVLVSAVEDVVTLGRDRIEPPLQGSSPGVILGVARVGAAPTVLFDAYALYG